MDAATYDVRKVVQNRVIREVDEKRQREMRQWMGIGAVLVLVLLGSVWQHSMLRQYAYRLENLQQQLAAEAETRRRLQLEIDTLTAPRHVEQIATTRLHLVQPRQQDTVIIDRVLVPEPPPSSVVAARH